MNGGVQPNNLAAQNIGICQTRFALSFVDPDTPPTTDDLAMHRLAFMLAASAPLIVSTAEAQSPAQPWPTTQWVVHCQGGQPCSEGTLQPTSAASIAERLTKASRWLESLGFRAPELETTPSAAGGQAYSISLATGMPTGTIALFTMVRPEHGPPRNKLELASLRYADGTAFAAVAVKRAAQDAAKADSLEMSLEQYLGENNATSVHELFHGVQASYGFNAKDTPGWILEGSAEALMHAWMAHIGEPYQLRDVTYDVPLYEIGGTGGYEAEHFWFHLGLDLNSRGQISYLADFMRSPVSDQRGIRWLDANLAPQRGLYTYLPHFVARQVADTTLFSSHDVVKLSTGRPDVRLVKTIPDLATHAVRVDIRIPSGERAGLEIRLKDDHPDLHLVIDDLVLNTATGNRPRNTYRDSYTKQSRDSTYTYLLRLVNVNPDPDGSTPQNYELLFALRDLDSCSPARMALAVNHDAPLTGMLDPKEYDPDESMRPAESSLAFSGLISDKGDACTQGVGVATLMSGVVSDPDGTGAIMRQRAEAILGPQGTRDAARLRELAASGKLTAQDVAKLTATFQGFNDAPEGKGNVVLHTFSPHLATWQLGILGTPFGVEHTGAGGWRVNAAANLFITLPNTLPADLKSGKEYPAIAYAPSEGESGGARPGVPSLTAFYTSWQGEWRNIARPPPRSAEEAAEQANSRAMCVQIKAELEAMMRELGDAAGAIPKEAIPQDCDSEGRAFGGELRALTGTLTGTVSIEAVTGGVVTGTFTLTGTGRLKKTRSTFIYSGALVTGVTKMTDETEGPLQISGTFTAAADQDGNPLGAWGKTVRLDTAKGQR